ncbi:GrpB family protein [Streptomyces rimosus]
MVTLESWPSRNQRILRDHLRKYPADAARYAQLKQSLAATGASSDTYTEAKTELIQKLTDRARAERGLPAAPVWE